jgi:choline dehydrogenase
MLSGIGPAAQLSRHNIPVVLDAPGVGANLLDHPTVPLRLKEKTGKSFNHLVPYNMRTTCLFMRDLLRYQLWGTGPIASNVSRAFLAFTYLLNNVTDG